MICAVCGKSRGYRHNKVFGHYFQRVTTKKPIKTPKKPYQYYVAYRKGHTEALLAFRQRLAFVFVQELQKAKTTKTIEFMNGLEHGLMTLEKEIFGIEPVMTENLNK